LVDQGQTTQCPKENVQKDKQLSTKHTYKIKDRVTRTPLKTGVNSSTSDTRPVNLVKNPVISHDRGKDREVLTTSGTIDSEGRLRTKLSDIRGDFNFHTVNFPFVCSNIPAATAYGVYISASLFDKVDQSDDVSDHIKRK
jgi:hypothetical protein